MSLGETSGSELDLNMPLNSVGGNKLLPCLVKVIAIPLDLLCAFKNVFVLIYIYFSSTWLPWGASLITPCITTNQATSS